MEKLFEKKDQLLRLTKLDIIRDMMNHVNWNAQLICIRGPRGVGKSTLLLQYIKSHYPAMSQEVLYCSLDSVYFTSHSLLDLAEQFYKNGGKHLFLDEVHKYDTWSKEVKEIYDLYPDMRVVLSGSSVLNILNGDADLSRRCVPYEMQGLSFREFLRFYKQIDLPCAPIEEILEHPQSLCSQVLDTCHPLPLFKEYLKYGYYPFYLRHSDDYYTLIDQMVSYVVETELPQVYHVEVSMVRRIKALLGFLADSIPYEVDAAKLSTTIGIHRTTVVGYLYLLDKAKMTNIIFADNNSLKKLQKPDKVYLENPNMLYALTSSQVEIGTARETFAVNQLKYNHTIEYGKACGDFRIDNRYTVEVGGQSKKFSQVAGVKDSFVLSDDIETPFGRKIPLWLLGFLY